MSMTLLPGTPARLPHMRPSGAAVTFEGSSRWWGAKKDDPSQPADPVPSAGNRPLYINPRKGRLMRATMLKLEYLGRLAAARLMGRKQRELFDQLKQKLEAAPENTEAFIRAMQEAAMTFVGDREIEINTESGRLAKIVQDDAAYIFIMNHDHQLQDPSLLGMFTSVLYQEYLEAGKGATCPRPRVLMNRDILDTLHHKATRTVYEKMGAVGVDASVGTEEQDTFKQVLKDWLVALAPRSWKKTVKAEIGPGGVLKIPGQNAASPTKSENSRVIKGLMKDFAQDKVHLFLFPEGRLSGITDDVMIRDFLALSEADQQRIFPLEMRLPGAPLADQLKEFALIARFQQGISNMVRLAAGQKKQVKVVPLGFAYASGEQDPETKQPKQLGSIYIGEPIVFELDKATKTLMASAGNITAEDARPRFAHVFRNQIAGVSQMRPFLETESKELTSAISGVLCENLRIAKEKALQILPHEEADASQLVDPLGRVPKPSVPAPAAPPAVPEDAPPTRP